MQCACAQRLGDQAHAHLTAEFLGVPAEQLRDAALLGGLLIAAASAGGLQLELGVPIVRTLIRAACLRMLLLERRHLAVHCASRPPDSAVRRRRAGFARLSQSGGCLRAPPDRRATSRRDTRKRG